MRVLVATDRIGALGSAAAGATMGAAWAERGHTVRVVPAGEAGQGFLSAAADQYGLSVRVTVQGDVVTSTATGDGMALLRVEDPEPGSGLPLTRTSAALGHALAGVVGSRRPRRVLIDLTGSKVHDAGAGMLAALGAQADQPLNTGPNGLAGLHHVDLKAPVDRLVGVELIGVVPTEESSRPLCGLRGITSWRGREAGLDPAVLLQVDKNLSTFAELAGPDAADRPGAGACGGLGFAVLALGGRLRTGTSLALDDALDVKVPARFDLVVTGCSAFDFGTRGGGVVATAAARAADYLAPCVVVAGQVLIGSREMRTLGVEAAYAVHDSDAGGYDVTEVELARTAARVVRSWSW